MAVTLEVFDRPKTSYSVPNLGQIRQSAETGKSRPWSNWRHTLLGIIQSNTQITDALAFVGRLACEGSRAQSDRWDLSQSPL